MNQHLVFWTAFNSYRSDKCLRGKPDGAPHPVTTAEWTADRAKFWRRYTLPSILSQSIDDWTYVVLLDPDLKSLVDPVLPANPDPRVIYAYQDDEALDRIKRHDQITLALIDGDDMYSTQAGEIMLACPDEWMYFRFGYAYDSRKNKAWRYDTIGTGPFFARKMDPRTLDAFDRAKRNPTHKAVTNHNPYELPANHFCVVLHNSNTSSTPQMRYVLRDKPVRLENLRKRFGRLV